MSASDAEPLVLGPKARQRGAYVLLAPALLVIGLFLVYPIAWLLVVSMTDYDPVTSTASPAGLSRYAEVITSPAVWRSILNTAYFSAVYLPLVLLASGALALLLRGRVLGRPVLKAIFCSPCVVPAVGIALIWRSAFVPNNGSLDRLLYVLGYEHGSGWAGWLAEPYLAMPCIALMCAWRDTGFFALILLSALERIPREAYEMARTDGASAWQTFTSVTLPMCLGTLGLCLVLLLVNVQQVFQEIYVMTEDGGPANWTLNLSFLVYRKAFFDYAWGRAARLSVLMLVLTAVLVLILNQLLRKRMDWS